MAAYYLRFMPHYSDSTAPPAPAAQEGCYVGLDPSLPRSRAHHQTAAHVPAHTDPFQLDRAHHGHLRCLRGSARRCALPDSRGGGTPVAFASRALTPAEQKYSVGEREALACLWACERWHVYLYGRPFTIRTDHQALTALLATQGSGHRPMRLLRWADRLNQYNFSLEFMPGRANTVADLLSRAVSVTKETGGVGSRHRERRRLGPHPARAPQFSSHSSGAAAGLSC